MNPFCGASDTPVLDFWWHLPWVSKPGWIPHLHALLPVCNEFLRFTSGATPADLLVANMAVGYIPYTHVAEVGCQYSIGRPPAQWADVLSTWLKAALNLFVCVLHQCNHLTRGADCSSKKTHMVLSPLPSSSIASY